MGLHTLCSFINMMVWWLDECGSPWFRSHARHSPGKNAHSSSENRSVGTAWTWVGPHTPCRSPLAGGGTRTASGSKTLQSCQVTGCEIVGMDLIISMIYACMFAYLFYIHSLERHRPGQCAAHGSAAPGLIQVNKQTLCARHAANFALLC